jgi:hypothetical protein
VNHFPRPYLQGEVEFSDGRERHITERHPDLLPEHRDQVASTLAGPVGATPTATMSGAGSTRWSRAQALAMTIMSVATSA